MPGEAFYGALKRAEAHIQKLPLSWVGNPSNSWIKLSFGEAVPIERENGEVVYLPLGRIWVVNSAWRIMREGRYYLGSGDPRSRFCEMLTPLLGLRVQSISICSSLFDLLIHFESGYSLSTFVYGYYDVQWMIFLKSDWLGTNFKAEHARDRLRRLARMVPIWNRFERVHTPVDAAVVCAVAYEDGGIRLHTNRDLDILVNVRFWRLERFGELCTSNSGSDGLVRKALRHLKGLSIERIECTDNAMETRFYVGEYILSLFIATEDRVSGWGIYQGFAPQGEVPFRCLASYPSKRG